jgi:hypothetical protein
MTVGDDIRKAWFKSKTFLFNLVLTLAGAVSLFQPVVDELESAGVDPQTVSALRVGLLLVGAIGMVLRGMTAGGVKLK